MEIHERSRRNTREIRRLDLEIKIGGGAFAALTWSPLPLLAIGHPWLALGALTLFLLLVWAGERIATPR
jgi:hypothetical protein